jgi:hypothetical protein
LRWLAPSDASKRVKSAKRARRSQIGGRFCRLTALALAGCLAAAATAGDVQLEDVLRGLEELSGMDQIAQVQLLHIPYTVETHTRVTAHLLYETASLRCQMPFTRVNGVELLNALRTARPQNATQEADLRWGAIFLDPSGRPIHSLYVNGKYLLPGVGRLGYIDGINVELQPGLGDWFERNLALCRTQGAPQS